MTQGPFGIPRITELGPFSSDDVSIEFEEDRQNVDRPPRELINIINSIDDPVAMRTVERVERRIVLKQKPNDGASDILNNTKDRLAEIGKTVSYIRYFIVDNNIGYIHKTRVRDKFQRRGIGSALRSTALEDMKTLGVTIVYTMPVSDAGEGLARSQGFTESGIDDVLSKDLN